MGDEEDEIVSGFELLRDHAQHIYGTAVVLEFLTSYGFDEPETAEERARLVVARKVIEDLSRIVRHQIGIVPYWAEDEE